VLITIPLAIASGWLRRLHQVYRRRNLPSHGVLESGSVRHQLDVATGVMLSEDP
jgi:hypothetical protein